MRRSLVCSAALFLVALLLLLPDGGESYYIRCVNNAGNYNVSTSVPATQRMDASSQPAFIVADDINVPLGLTRCDSVAVDVTLEIAVGTTATEPAFATFWIFPDSAFGLNTTFNPDLAVATQTFTAPSDGSWSRSGAVREWTVGSQVIYVVTPRFVLTNGTALRGNTTYWIAMVIGQERRISAIDSTFNTARWLLTGTPTSPIGSVGQLRGVDRYGTMFRAYPNLVRWSNASVVESVTMPFMSYTATASLTHQTALTVYLGLCYAPANVVFPSSRNFTALPSPTAYATQTPPVTVVDPPLAAAPTTTKAPAPPSPRTTTSPPVSSPVRAPASVPVRTPAIQPQEAPAPEAIPTPLQPSVPQVAQVEQPHNNPPFDVLPPAPLDGPVDKVNSAPPTASLFTNPFSSPLFISLLVLAIAFFIIATAALLIFIARRFRTRVTRDSYYGDLGEGGGGDDDSTKEVELDEAAAANGGDIHLSDSGSDSYAAGGAGPSGVDEPRAFNGTLKAEELEDEYRANTTLSNVRLDGKGKRSEKRGRKH